MAKSTSKQMAGKHTSRMSGPCLNSKNTHCLPRYSWLPGCSFTRVICTVSSAKPNIPGAQEETVVSQPNQAKALARWIECTRVLSKGGRAVEGILKSRMEAPMLKKILKNAMRVHLVQMINLVGPILGAPRDTCRMLLGVFAPVLLTRQSPVT
jgi:hypothetical protein